MPPRFKSQTSVTLPMLLQCCDCWKCSSCLSFLCRLRPGGWSHVFLTEAGSRCKIGCAGTSLSACSSVLRLFNSSTLRLFRCLRAALSPSALSLQATHELLSGRSFRPDVQTMGASSSFFHSWPAVPNSSTSKHPKFTTPTKNPQSSTRNKNTSQDSKAYLHLKLPRRTSPLLTMVPAPSPPAPWALKRDTSGRPVQLFGICGSCPKHGQVVGGLGVVGSRSSTGSGVGYASSGGAWPVHAAG